MKSVALIRIKSVCVRIDRRMSQIVYLSLVSGDVLRKCRAVAIAVIAVVLDPRLIAVVGFLRLSDPVSLLRIFERCWEQLACTS